MIYELVYNYIFVFDNVVINIGNVYNIQFGKFIVLNYGFYVFIWIISIWGLSYYIIELLVDNSVVYVVFLNLGNVIDGIVNGIVVVYVIKDRKFLLELVFVLINIILLVIVMVVYYLLVGM